MSFRLGIIGGGGFGDYDSPFGDFIAFGALADFFLRFEVEHDVSQLLLEFGQLLEVGNIG